MSKKDQETISLHLTQVLEDIGVNEQMVKKRQYMSSQNETMMTIPVEHTKKCYIFDSIADGTTTMGLESTQHILWCPSDHKVIQNKSEWDDHAFNLLMLQKGAPPGYCLLQKMGHNKHSYESLTFFKSMVLLKSNKDVLHHNYPEDVSSGQFVPDVPAPQRADTIKVKEMLGYKLESWPNFMQDWFNETNEKNKADWPTADMRRHCKTTSCFAVPIPSKNSKNQDFEWQISTQEAEQYLIRTLNMTQVRCYVLMKMLLQSYINPQKQNFITSYICKTVVFHGVHELTAGFWKENNLLTCLQYCLEKLVNYIKTENCPHFFIPENNLLAGLLPETKSNLLYRMEIFISYDKLSNVLCKLLIIPNDNLDERLDLTLTNGRAGIKNIPYQDQIKTEISGQLLLNFVSRMYTLHHDLLKTVEQPLLLQYLSRFLCHSVNSGNSQIQQVLANQTAAFLCTSIASAIASTNIRANQTISHEAIFWYSGGMNSDALSSRLKFASATYCSGDVQGARSILSDSKINNNQINQMCVCHGGHMGQKWPINFKEGDINICSFAGTCVKFLPYERYCVPQEMVYEMYRSTVKERKQRSRIYQWLDWAVIDPLVYTSFLKYKVSRDLKQEGELITSLITIMYHVHRPGYLGHQETALNLLGKCLEQEGQEIDAINCYLESCTVQATNNAARWHLCKLLAKLVKQRAPALNAWGISLWNQRQKITKEIDEPKNPRKTVLKVIKQYLQYRSQ